MTDEIKRDLRALMIDDNEDDVIIVIRRLVKSGWNVHYERVDTAKDMQIALEKSWDLVISDFSMPGFDGFSALNLLKSTGLDIPFIIVSGAVGEDTAVALMKSGASDYIMKDNLTRLAPAIERELREAEIRRQKFKTSQTLIENEARLRMIMDSIFSGIILVDLETNQIVDINSQACEILGLSKSDSIGKPCGQILCGSASGCPVILENDQLYHSECVIALPNSEPKVILLTATRVMMNNKLHILENFIDITEKREMEKRLVESQKLADIGTLVAGVAHEINSPLQVITGTSEGLINRINRKEKLSDKFYLERLEMIRRNGWRSAEIVGALRNYARSVPEEFDRHNLNEIVKDSLLLIEHQIKHWSNIEINTNLAPHLPPIKCNHNKIIQVLINLLTNAQDAMPVGGEIKITTARQADKLVLKVADTGLGIPEEIKSHIFEPFFTTKPVGKGTGLGLSIVKKILEAHHAEISIESEKDRGTQFIIQFPTENE